VFLRHSHPLRAKTVDKTFFSKKIISWYEEYKRDLPWRLTRDPYKIWLSEIILQQTRVAQGLPYYLRFVENFPDVISLANAKEDRVLRLWQGLGYYSRARNLHACAKEVKEKFEGSFPSTYEGLIGLPGIGSYTAAAIASFAFREPVAVVDGNVYRVLARVFGIDLDISSHGGKSYFFEKANELIDQQQPDLFNQAVMEFGALHCTPKNPKCDSCIFITTCIANKHEQQTLLPVKSKKQAIKKRFFTYIILEHRGRLLMKKRKPGDIWNGLYDFFLVESPRQLNPQKLVMEIKELKGLIPEEVSKGHKHILSHQLLMTRFVWIKIPNEQKLKPFMRKNELTFYSKKQVANLPKPILVTRFLHDSNYLD
jgi:A/G-specific adenine glycosylase